MKKKLMSLLLALVLVAALLPAMPSSAAGEKLIAVTFDDGPSQYTSTLLDGLKQRGVKATFFMQGINAANYPAVVKRAWLEGHQICSHTYNHPQLTTLSGDNVRSQLSRTDSILDNAIGFDLTYMLRPPYGSYNQSILNIAGVPCLYWSVDTLDWKSRNADSVYQTFLNNARDGSIVLLHDLYSTSVTGALRAIDTLQAQGYQFVTVDELFYRRGITMQNATIYFNAYPGSAGTASAIQTPVITKSEATSGGLTISISGDSRGSVYYTTNGETPTPANAKKYTGPFTVNGSCTIKAQSVIHWNSIRSNVATETIEYIPAPAPVLNWHYADWLVSLEGTDLNSVVHFTLDGSVPTLQSEVFEYPLCIGPNTTVRAIAEQKGRAPSAISMLTVTEGLNVMRDVNVKDWYYENLAAAVDQGIINGTAPEIMSPNKSLTRAMLVTMLYRMSGAEAEAAPVSYTDVKADAYYYEALCWATANGIVDGYKDGSFKPNADINRMELCAMIYRYLTMQGCDMPAIEDSTQRFTDAQSIGSWARPYVSALAELGVVNGYGDGTFGPKRGATRAEAVTVLMRAAQWIPEEPEVTPDPDPTPEPTESPAPVEEVPAPEDESPAPVEESPAPSETPVEEPVETPMVTEAPEAE